MRPLTDVQRQKIEMYHSIQVLLIGESRAGDPIIEIVDWPLDHYDHERRQMVYRERRRRLTVYPDGSFWTPHEVLSIDSHGLPMRDVTFLNEYAVEAVPYYMEVDIPADS